MIKGEPLERVPQVNISMVSQFVIIIFFTLLYLFWVASSLGIVCIPKQCQKVYSTFSLVGNRSGKVLLDLDVNNSLFPCTQTKPCEDNEEGTSLNAVLADLAKVNNSRDRASKLFQWLIHPVPAKDFFRFVCDMRHWNCLPMPNSSAGGRRWFWPLSLYLPLSISGTHGKRSPS